MVKHSEEFQKVPSEMKIWRNPYKLLSKFYVGTLEIKIYGAVRRILDL